MDRSLFSHIASIIIFLIILYGITKRFDKHTHRKIMLSAFGLDVLLLLYIEFGREAVKQAMEFPSGWLGIHIIFSSLTVVMYILVIYFGNRLFKGDESIRQKHKTMAYTFMIVKSCSLITSYLF